MIRVKKEIEMDNRYSAVQLLFKIFDSEDTDDVWSTVSRPVSRSTRSDTLMMNFVCELMRDE